jgi:NADPH-dependent 2,4-dienoyl-CoA reductase/sulfur reductase-like enzyme
MSAECDLAVIGAGPAGIAAACTAAELGLRVTLLDEQGEPGGQIYRAIETVGARRPQMLDTLGADYAHGVGLTFLLRASAVDYVSRAIVWNVAPDCVVSYSVDGGSRSLRARRLLVATGAIERPVPLPGWTLPGVVTVGGLQILLKAQGLVPEGRVVLAGAGPLLLLLATQYLAVGVQPAAIVETAPRGRYLDAIRHLPAALRAPDPLRKGVAMLRTIRASGIPMHRSANDLRIVGNDRAEAIEFQAAGRRHSIAADVVALHQGVVPNQQVTRLLGCAHDWSAAQRCFHPRRDDWFQTTVAGVSVAGDGGGIAGAKAAELSGRLAALAIAAELGRIDAGERDRRAAADRAALRREQAIRPFLDALYPPSPEALAPADDVVLCRCEEVTAGQVREAVRLGCLGPNQAKSFLRCGMGPCQGRTCGLAVGEVIAAARGVSPAAVGYFGVRPPLKPLTLGELATAAGAGGG